MNLSQAKPQKAEEYVSGISGKKHFHGSVTME